MKNLDRHGPPYSLFDLSTAPNDLDSALAATDRFSPFPTVNSYVWDAAQRPHPRNAEVRRRGFYRRAGKRFLDITLILISLPFSLLIIGLCALALWFEGGSPFYTQKRLGRGAKPYQIYKLRTMVRNADAILDAYLAADPKLQREWDELQKLHKDPRVTRVGSFLRATSLDELPQLFNVLKGDMSLIGPRPMIPDQLGMYGDATAYSALRPGITGLWQISARNSSRFNYRQEVDAAYERSLSLKTDLAILVKTVDVVIRKTGC